jgi:glycosyltransferase involved in cell wall biosynthesis
MKNKYLVLGFGLPKVLQDKVLLDDPGMPTQTFKFADNLKKALLGSSSEVFLVSTEPVINYPANPNVYFKFKRFIDAVGVRGFTLPFINIIFLKHMSRFLAGLILVVRVLFKRDYDAVFVHGIHSPFLLIANIVKYIFKIKIICIVTDPPVIPKNAGYIEIQARKIDRLVIFLLLKKFDGLIVLSELFIKDNSFLMPYMVLDGFCGDTLTSNRIVEKSPDDLFSFAYAGGLNEEYGVKNLVQAAIQLENIELTIYGKGPLDQYLTEASRTYGHIIYKGFLEPEKIADRLIQANCLVNPRPSTDDFVRYSFPSKVIEYMALGVPLLTTHLPSIPEDFLPHVLVIEDETVLGLVNSLRKVSTMSQIELDFLANSGKSFVVNTRSCKTQGSKINKFINSI